jgi:hypothetical protein
MISTSLFSSGSNPSRTISLGVECNRCWLLNLCSWRHDVGIERAHKDDREMNAPTLDMTRQPMRSSTAAAAVRCLPNVLMVDW